MLNTPCTCKLSIGTYAYNTLRGRTQGTKATQTQLHGNIHIKHHPWKNIGTKAAQTHGGRVFNTLIYIVMPFSNRKTMSIRVTTIMQSDIQWHQFHYRFMLTNENRIYKLKTTFPISKSFLANEPIKLQS